MKKRVSLMVDCRILAVVSYSSWLALVVLILIQEALALALFLLEYGESVAKKSFVLIASLMNVKYSMSSHNTK